MSKYESSNHADKTVLVSMLSGLFAGAFAKLITHPIDTIKAKIQVNTDLEHRPTISSSLTKTLKSEKIAGLYRGLPVSVFGSMPASVLYFGSYEYAKKHLLLMNILQKVNFKCIC